MLGFGVEGLRSDFRMKGAMVSRMTGHRPRYPESPIPLN